MKSVPDSATVEFPRLLASDPGNRVVRIVALVVAWVVDAGYRWDPVVLEVVGTAERAREPYHPRVIECRDASLVDQLHPLAGVALPDLVRGEQVVYVREVHRRQLVALGVVEERLVPVLGAEAEVDDAGLRTLRQVRPRVVVAPQRLDLPVALRVRTDRRVVEVCPTLIRESRVLRVPVALHDLAPQVAVPPAAFDLRDHAALDGDLDVRVVAGVVARSADHAVQRRHQLLRLA